jgi:hypothetical protein
MSIPMNSSDDLKKKELLFAIHRHWIWANRVREEYGTQLRANPPASGDMLDWFLNSSGMHMCLWYGLLFSVCEGLRENGFSVPAVQAEIDGIYDALRLFRNAIFHVQSEYWSPKLFRIMEDPQKVHEGLGEWFLTQIGSGRPKNTWFCHGQNFNS